MALAEWIGMGAHDVRTFGVAGLLHDLGKVKIPLEVLNKAGKLTDEERRIMNLHPTEGARIIISSEPELDMAAVVAYEHHIMLNGGGYPKLAFPRDCHEASKLVHVCDVYDALRTNRPYLPRGALGCGIRGRNRPRVHEDDARVGASTSDGCRTRRGPGRLTDPRQGTLPARA
jgi:HD-GYP domain-containing protein (c-di-GMP phosphodiesterase class II)